MDKKLKTMLGIGLVVVVGWLTASKKLLVDQNPVKQEPVVENVATQRGTIMVGSVELPVEIRKTAEEMELGLSYRDKMGSDEGMAFVYPQPQRVMFWMKGMNFPLDFIWVARGMVVEVTEKVPAPTRENPVATTVVPASEVDLVIEVNSGFVARSGIRVGDEVLWKN